MEKIINKLNDVKQDLIGYIIDVANLNKLSYLFVNDDKQDNVKIYYIEIDNKSYITEDIVYRLNTFNIELLAKFCAKLKQDLNKVLWSDNGHDYKLVNKINECWVKKKDDFIYILQQLMWRDELECFVNFPNVNIQDLREIEKYATELLTHICDDKDLECIIAYCRI